MLKINSSLFLSILIVLFCQSLWGKEVYKEPGVYDFNFNWRFIQQPVCGAEEKNFDDQNWMQINLPHDWSISQPFDSTLEGCTAYLPGGIGWYRKTFHLNIDTVNTKVFILFDGVYNNAKFWINGKYLGEHPYGYSPFYYELTPYLSPNNDNTLAVLVDRLKYADSRWYTGSGIYRSVKLIVKNKVYVPIWGAFIRLEKLKRKESEHSLTFTVLNAFKEEKNVKVKIEISEKGSGRIVSKIDREVFLKPNERRVFNEKIKIKKPLLWDIEKPNLYHFKISLYEGKKKLDQYQETFGIRSFSFDAQKGFFLNGKNIKLKGVCLHHDAGLIGASMLKGVWERRLKKLKAMGCNAIRISHNPAATEFLDLCDSLGFVVIEEFFDEWDYPKDKRYNTNEKERDYVTDGYAYIFEDNWKSDLQNTVFRDRNHASIFMWSIGNEIEWTYPIYKIASGYFDADWHGNYFWEPPRFEPAKIKERYAYYLEKMWQGKHRLEETAKKLADFTRQLDPTRLITANLIFPSVSFNTGYTDVLDVVGFSYRRVVYDWAHKYFPDKPLIGSENVGQWHEWKAVLERPFVGGTFIWTGIDYLGEATNRWPLKGLRVGFFDTAGFDKPSYHMFKSLWCNKPHVYVATQILQKSLYKYDPETKALVERKTDGWQKALWQWHDVNEHWNYQSGDSVVAEVYSNCPEVELFLNGRSLGRKKLADFEDHIYKWLVPFQPGTLNAVGYKEGKKVEYSLITANEPVFVKLTADKNHLKNDGYDVIHIVAELQDNQGTPVRHQQKKLEFVVDGPVEILGGDNGSMETVQNFHSNNVVTWNGKALLILKSKQKASGKISVQIKGQGLKSNKIKIQYVN